jgi:sec-independent protein translocase protein TatA
MGTILFLSAQHILIVMIVVLMLFGADKIPEVAKGIGKGMRDFKKATDDIRKEIEESTRDIRTDMNDIQSSIRTGVNDFSEKLQKDANDVSQSMKIDMNRDLSVADRPAVDDNASEIKTQQPDNSVPVEQPNPELNHPPEAV